MANDPDKDDKAIGVVGLGNMGAGIARNLARRFAPVFVWDIDADACDPFAGADGVEVALPKEIASRSEVVLFLVPNSHDIEDLLTGSEDMLGGMGRGTVICDLTTSDPVHSRSLAEKVAGAGVTYIDGGMSGGATGADAGSLTLMLGGDRGAFEAIAPVLDAIADKLFHLGPSGAGHTLKLILNMVIHTNFLAVCEAGHMAKAAGIELGDMIDVFNVSNARSYASEVRFPKHIVSGTWDGRSRVYNLHKDVGMAMELAKSLGTSAKLGAETFRYLVRAVEAGMQEEDFTRLYPALHGLRGSGCVDSE
jgi:3-hydroxyisobutyrate dehydrogenase